MQTYLPKSGSTECARYFRVPGAHLYTVLHEATEPLARVLLVGAFASERQFAYHSWVRWARYLSARRIEVLRYDYRGIGESTGDFAEMGFKDWDEDVRLLASWIESQSPHLPFLIHGMELGAILGSRCFERGVGDALLLWAPPVNANHVLRATLRHWSGLGQLYESPKDRKTASQYIRELERGGVVEVQGYAWSSRLWRDSFQLELPAFALGEDISRASSLRPVKLVKFGKNASSLTMPYVRYSMAENLEPLYSETYGWMGDALGIRNVEER